MGSRSYFLPLISNSFYAWIIGCALIGNCLQAAEVETAVYQVHFADKKGVSFNPYTYFDPLAIERRLRHNIPLDSYTDRPLNSSYVQAVSNICDSVLQTSRWLNVLFVEASYSQKIAIEQLPFVKKIQPTIPLMASLSGTATINWQTREEEALNKTLLKHQTSMMGDSIFRARGISGKGVRIAVLDAGFPSVNTHAAFAHIRARNGIIDTYDFVKKKPGVYAFSSHGTSVLSCIAGIYQGQAIGLATDAEFLLARTERAHGEPLSEERNWLAAVEWADKNGASIINSSLAYTYHRYFTEEMDGASSLVSQAARIATRKGILVVNAAGNDGDKDWKIIATPADVDSVLTVGGIDPNTNRHIDFSSYGPTANNQRKPNVAALGHVVAANKTALSETYGTSFAAPLIAGFAACILSDNKALKVMELFQTIQESGHLYPYYDYAHGYGVPNASNYFIKNAVTDTALRITEYDDYFELSIPSTVLDSLQEQGETSDSSSTSNIEQLLKMLTIKTVSKQDYLYYHIENKSKVLDYYAVVKLKKGEPFCLFKNDLKRGTIIRAHYQGLTQTINY